MIKEINSLFQWFKFIEYYITDKININFEISVSNMIPHSLYLSPRNRRIQRQQFIICMLINLLETFADGLNKHTISSNLLHTCRRFGKFVKINNSFYSIS